MKENTVFTAKKVVVAKIVAYFVCPSNPFPFPRFAPCTGLLTGSAQLSLIVLTVTKLSTSQVKPAQVHFSSVNIA